MDMDILKTLKSQAEQVEVISLSNEATSIDYEANLLKNCKIEETSGQAVRVIRHGKMGFAGSTDLKSQEKLAANALESASYGDEAVFDFPAGQPAQEVNAFDPTIATLSVVRLVEMGKEIVDTLVSYDPLVHANVSIKRAVQKINLSNQAGLDISQTRSPFSIIFDVLRTDGDDMLNLYEMNGTTMWEDDYLAPAHRLGQKLQQAREIVDLRGRRMPVIFTPLGGLVLLLPLMEGFNGKNVFTGLSPLGGKLGQKLFDEKINLADDATLPGRFNSAAYDDEGVPHHRTPLITNGVLENFLYDLKTAAQAGAQTTGNGTRTLFYPPEPAPSNLVLQAGQTPLAEMIAGIDEGLMIDSVLGLGQGNIISGAFSNPLNLGFKIKKGKIVGRVKGAAIANNAYDLLKNIAAISRETQWVNYNACLPYLMLPDLNVVTKQ
jgi:PmbA protein